LIGTRSRRFRAWRIPGWKYLVAAAALAWSIFLIGALTIPETDGNHVPALATGGGILLGGFVYAVLIRTRLKKGAAGPPDISAT
ncbi:MAG: hypothetical protein JSU96_07600, partial [Acidobacteriota bacterium]